MAQKIEIEGFEGQMISVKPASFLSGVKLLMNGEPAPRGPKRGQMLLRRNDGTEAVATWQPTMLGFDMPKLVVDGEAIETAKPIKWYEMAWSAIPILLVFMGGLLGGIAGFIGFSVNAKIFRSEINTPLKFLFTAGISILSGIAYFLLAMVLYAVIG